MATPPGAERDKNRRDQQLLVLPAFTTLSPGLALALEETMPPADQGKKLARLQGRAASPVADRRPRQGNGIERDVVMLTAPSSSNPNVKRQAGQSSERKASANPWHDKNTCPPWRAAPAPKIFAGHFGEAALHRTARWCSSRARIPIFTRRVSEAFTKIRHSPA